MGRLDEDALKQMRERGGTWAAYENRALDSSTRGHHQFLKVGEGCTHTTPPLTYPADTSSGTGWKYVFIGMVNLETGEVS